MQILSSLVCLQEGNAQTVTESGISLLEAQLKDATRKLTSIDVRLRLMEENLIAITREMNNLKVEEASSKGLWSKFTGIFKRRKNKIGNLYARSQDLSYKMETLQEEKLLLVNKYVTLADTFIEKADLRMITLVKAVREADANNDIANREKHSKELFKLWELTEKTRKNRNKYASSDVEPDERYEPIDLPTLVGNDPEKLRPLSAALKDAAESEMVEVARLDKQISDLKKKEKQLEQLIELAEDIGQRDEERGATGIGVDPSLVLRGGDPRTKMELEDTKRKINELLEKKKEHEQNAKGYAQEAKQIDVRLKGNIKDD